MPKVNARQFIYWVLHKKYPQGYMSGRTVDHKTKIINGIPIDEHIPTEAMKKLMNNKLIETRSSCEGDSEDSPTFLIIRIPGKSEKEIKKFVKNLNKNKGVISNYDIGNSGNIRIGITGNIWYDKDPKEFEKWWNELPKKN